MFCRGKVSFAVEKYVLPWKSKVLPGKIMFCRGKVKFCRGKVCFAVEKYVLPWKSMFCGGKVSLAVEK